MTARKPTAMKRLEGTDKQHPGRIPKREPKSPLLAADTPPPPSIAANKHALWAWSYIVPVLAEMKVATKADMFGLIQLCEAWGRYMSTRVPVRREKAWAEVARMLTEYGLTPASRPKVAAMDGEGPADPFEAWQNRGLRPSPNSSVN